jgi:DNA-binding protein H-NS
VTLHDVIGVDPAPVNGKPTRRRRMQQGQAAPKPSQPVRFRGPEGQTWSGRGPTPRWLKALEAAGKPRDEFMV